MNNQASIVFPKKLIVDDLEVDDISTVTVSSEIADMLDKYQHDAVMLTRRKNKTYAIASENEEQASNSVTISKVGRLNLHINLGEYVFLSPVRLKHLSQVSIAPVKGKEVAGNLYEVFLKPFFQDNYRPVSTGLSFSVVSGLIKHYFKDVDVVLPSNPEPIQPGQETSGESASSAESTHELEAPFADDAGIIGPFTNILLMPEIENDENYEYVGYSDIGGHKDAIKKIREAVEMPLMYPELFQKIGIQPPAGVLLHGPPGTGKTMIARALANETGAFFFLINGPEIMSKMSGESEANLRRAFEVAAKNSPAIIFIDEIDSIAPKREKTGGDVDKRVVSMLLTLMDGVKKRERVLVLAATNRPSALDPALRRFGRFDREVEIGVPNEEGRMEILKIHSKKMKLDEEVEIQKIAERTHGMVGADLAQLCTEAAFNCLRRFETLVDLDAPKLDMRIFANMKVTKEDFAKAIKSVDPSMLRENHVQAPEVKWEDIGGLEEIKEEMREMVQYPLIYPEVYRAYGQPPAKGCLLWGPPGCGKTMLAKAIATEAEANFISVKGPELLTMWVGESEANVRELFNKARLSSPCIIFFDEIDSLAQKRGTDVGSSGVGDRVMNAILIELDGMNPSKQVYVIGATNRPEILDPALLRPGRLDSLMYVGLPDKETRKKVFEVTLKGTPVTSDVDLEELAELTEGFSNADITGLGKVSAKKAIRKALVTYKEEKAKFLKQTENEKRNKKRAHSEVIKEDGLISTAFKDGFPPIDRESLIEAISVTRPSVSPYEASLYAEMKKRFKAGSLVNVEEEKDSAKPVSREDIEKALAEVKKNKNSD